MIGNGLERGECRWLLVMLSGELGRADMKWGRGEVRVDQVCWRRLSLRWLGWVGSGWVWLGWVGLG